MSVSHSATSSVSGSVLGKRDSVAMNEPEKEAEKDTEPKDKGKGQEEEKESSAPAPKKRRIAPTLVSTESDTQSSNGTG